MEKTSFNIFIATIVLGIIAFMSPTFLPLAAVKTIVIGIGVLASLVFYLVSRFKTKTLDIPTNSLIAVGGLIGVSIIVSVLFSASPYSSFLGKSFGSGAGIFLLTLLAAGLLASILIRTRERVFTTHLVITGSFVFVALFQLIRLLAGGHILSFGIFTTVTSTMIGSWYDLGILAGLVAVISIVLLQISDITKKHRILLIVSLALSLVFLVIIGFTYAWIALALTTLAVTLKKFLEAQRESHNSSFLSKISWLPICIFIFAVVFIYFGNKISTPVINSLGAGYNEVSLPWQYTLDVAEPTIVAVPFFGAGPDRFTNAFLQFKPQSINNTQFWAVNFPTGSNFILTSLVTQGLFGFVLWILFLILFVKQGIRLFTTKSRPIDAMQLDYPAVSFFGAVFLLLMTVFYVPSHAILLLTFVMVGLYIGGLVDHKHIASKTIEFVAKTKSAVAIKLLILFVGLLAIFGVILFFKETVSQVYFQSALQVMNTTGSTSNEAVIERVSQVKKVLQKAIAWNNVDINYQTLSQVDVYGVNTLIANATTTADPAIVAQVSALITEGVGYSRTAQSLDISNASNHLAEATMSEIATSIRITSAYENARNAYSRVLQLDPRNPSVYLSLAKLDYFVGSTSRAVSDLNMALQLKPNYTDALYQAGVISYNQKDYTTAESAFEQVVRIDGNYANAIYFLSLTLIRLGDTKDATILLTGLDKTYPNNQLITFVLSSLSSDKSPFADAVTPVSTNVDISTSTPKMMPKVVPSVLKKKK